MKSTYQLKKTECGDPTNLVERDVHINIGNITFEDLNLGAQTMAVSF